MNVTFNALSGRLRGKIEKNRPLGVRSWFRTGGAAHWFFAPEDQDDLAFFLKNKPSAAKLTVIGALSNTLVRDGGIPGATLWLGKNFAHLEKDGEGIIAGAGALDKNVAGFCAGHGLGGAEFLSGIPGTVGGAVRMNAGAQGSDTAAILDWIEFMQPDGTLHRIGAKDLGFSYRRSELPDGAIVLRVRLALTPNRPERIKTAMQAMKDDRTLSQPTGGGTCGSTFRNPPGHRAWKLIDAAGCRGLKRGGAQVSEKHCNFLLNLGNATASDLEKLGEEVRRRVLATSGISLQWEIKRVGEFLS